MTATLTFRHTKTGNKIQALHLFPRLQAYTDLACAIPGARPQDDGSITYALDPDFVTLLRMQLPDLAISDEVLAWHNEHTKRVQAHLEVAAQTDATLSVPSSSRLWPYQRVGAEWLHTRRRTILGDKMGLGKTAQSLVAAGECNAQRVLVVTTALAKLQWVEEVKTWLGREAIPLIGTIPERQKLFQEKPDIAIINYEMLQNPAKFPELLRTRWDVLILDEAQKIQNRDSKQSKTAKALAQKTPIVFELTGTPIWNMPDSIWHLLHILDAHRFRAYWTFVERYCTIRDTIYGRKVTGIRPDMRQSFQELLAEFLLQRTKEQVLPDLPPKIHTTHYYQLSPAQRNVYRSIKEQLILPREDDWQYYQNAAAVLAPLRRLCNAPAMLDLALPSPKDEALLDLVNTLLASESRIAIFCWHRDYVVHIADLLAKQGITSVVAIDTNADRRREQITAFKAGVQQVLLGTIAGMGTAIDLANIVESAIFAELDWTPAIVEQAEDRFHRFTSKKSVTIYRLVGRGTIEEHIFDVVQTKAGLANSLTALKDVIEKLRTAPGP